MSKNLLINSSFNMSIVHWAWISVKLVIHLRYEGEWLRWSVKSSTIFEWHSPFFDFSNFLACWHTSEVFHHWGDFLWIFSDDWADQSTTLSVGTPLLNMNWFHFNSIFCVIHVKQEESSIGFVHFSKYSAHVLCIQFIPVQHLSHSFIMSLSTFFCQYSKILFFKVFSIRSFPTFWFHFLRSQPNPRICNIKIFTI